MSKPAVQTWPPPTHLVPSPWLCWGNKDCLCLGFYLFPFHTLVFPFLITVCYTAVGEQKNQNQDMCSTTIFPPNKNPNVLLQVYRAHQLHQDRSPILVTWLNQVRSILLLSLAARFSERKLLPLSGFGLLGQTPSSLFSSSCSSLSRFLSTNTLLGKVNVCKETFCILSDNIVFFRVFKALFQLPCLWTPSLFLFLPVSPPVLYGTQGRRRRR